MIGRVGVKRRSYLGAHDQEAELVSCLLRTSCCSSPSGRSTPRGERATVVVCLQRSKGWLGHAHTSVSPVEAQWATSTPAKRVAEPNFDHELIGAWLGVQSPAPADGKTCSRMVQTEVSHNPDGAAGPAGMNTCVCSRFSRLRKTPAVRKSRRLALDSGQNWNQEVLLTAIATVWCS